MLADNQKQSVTHLQKLLKLNNKTTVKFTQNIKFFVHISEVKKIFLSQLHKSKSCNSHKMKVKNSFFE